MQRVFSIETPKKIGKKVRVCGWIHAIRSHGKIIFADLRDRSGILQTVLTADLGPAQNLRPEWVVEFIGTIKKRPQKMANKEIPTGKVEMEVKEVTVLSESKTPAFEITENSLKVNEEKRLKYRYLDLRTERMKNNIIVRHKAIKFIRDFMDRAGFIEVETPILTKSTPEGSRDFIVPSRLHPGKFFALPQSPQQYKQLLMVAGLEKYFQIARCLRDEDPRADRQAEHTQLDLEMSFAQEDDVMNLTEGLLIALVKKLYPEKKIQQIPFPHLTHEQAIKKHKSDKPDLRKNKNNPDELAFCWVIDFPFFEKDNDNKWTFTHNPFSSPKKEFINDLLNKKNIGKILTTQYDIVLNGSEIGGGSIRNHEPNALSAVFEIIGYKKKEIQEQFGHLLESFEFGAPPHGGIACGLDRWLAIFQGEGNIREVIAFPKTGDGFDPLMNSPAEITKDQLRELHIKVMRGKS